MSFLFGDLTMGKLQGVVFLNSEELVGVVTCDYNDVLISVVEGDLKRLHVLRLTDTIERETLLFVPVPQDDFVTILSSLCKNGGG
jgi:hypothetical protein